MRRHSPRCLSSAARPHAKDPSDPGEPAAAPHHCRGLPAGVGRHPSTFVAALASGQCRHSAWRWRLHGLPLVTQHHLDVACGGGASGARPSSALAQLCSHPRQPRGAQGVVLCQRAAQACRLLRDHLRRPWWQIDQAAAGRHGGARSLPHPLSGPGRPQRRPPCSPPPSRAAASAAAWERRQLRDKRGAGWAGCLHCNAGRLKYHTSFYASRLTRPYGKQLRGRAVHTSATVATRRQHCVQRERPGGRRAVLYRTCRPLRPC